MNKEDAPHHPLPRIQRAACLCIMLCIALSSVSQALAVEEFLAERKNRVELWGTYEYLSPHDTYEDWKALAMAFYRKELPDFLWFAHVEGFKRREGNGVLFGLGAYKDWTDSFYTYTAVSAGTNAVFLPQIRVDHDFNTKFGPEKKFVWLLGATYIQYHDVHRDYILSTGLSAYLGSWVAEYRLFRNLSEPGWAESYSHLLALAYGQDGKQWTKGAFSFGKQAYQATELGTAEAVNNNSYLVTLNHRRWLERDYGVFGEVSWFDLEKSYKKTGLLLGVFKEF